MTESGTWLAMVSGGWSEVGQPAFWVALLKIMWINILLSGDNAVVIAMACVGLPPRQRLWGMVLGAGVAVLLRIIFTVVIAQLMLLPYLKIVGGRGRRRGPGGPPSLARGAHCRGGRYHYEPRQCDRDRGRGGRQFRPHPD